MTAELAVIRARVQRLQSEVACPASPAASAQATKRTIGRMCMLICHACICCLGRHVCRFQPRCKANSADSVFTMLSVAMEAVMAFIINGHAAHLQT